MSLDQAETCRSSWDVLIADQLHDWFTHYSQNDGNYTISSLWDTLSTRMSDVSNDAKLNTTVMIVSTSIGDEWHSGLFISSTTSSQLNFVNIFVLLLMTTTTSIQFLNLYLRSLRNSEAG